MNLVLRPDYSVAYVGAALWQYYGLEPQRILEQPFVALVAAEDVPRVEAALATLSPANRSVVVDTRAKTPHDDERWLQWTCLAIYNTRDRLIEVHVFGRDLRGQRQAEKDAAYLAAIVAGADDAIVSKTLTGVITSWNPGAETMFGFSEAEAVGRSITLIIPPERLHEEAEILARLKRGEKTEHFQTERLHKSGRRVPISVNISPVHDASGAIIGASKIARDVTAEHKAREEFQASLRSLEVLYRLADLAGQAHDRGEVCNAALEAVATALGTSRAAVLLFDRAGVMRFCTSHGLSERYRAAVEGHSPWTPDSRDTTPILVPDARIEPTLAPLLEELEREGIRSLAFFPLLDEARVVGKFMVYFDHVRVWTPEELRLAETIGHHASFGLARVDAETTAADALHEARAARFEADAARRDAERASRAKDEFLAMLAHELRNPMGVIVHAARILAGQASLAADARRAVGMIERQSQHLASLLDDLLDVARITSGHIELQREPVDLAQVVTLALEAQRVRIGDKQQRVDVMLPSEPVTVLGDPVRLQQVVGNLVNNASKYTPAEGSIAVQLEAHAGEAILRVRDTGAGIPPEHLGSIFELFVQANPTLARTEGGLGVGLTLVKRVVDLHAGRVEARSEGLGRGAELTVRLPLAHEPAAVAGSSKPAPRLPTKRILVVEDHQDGREALAMLLRINGHDVHEAADGRTALARAKELQPDVVLLDIGLPDLDGYEVGQALRAALGARVHLVALTGYGQPGDRERTAKAGFDAHLVKPVDTDAIMETLASLV